MRPGLRLAILCLLAGLAMMASAGCFRSPDMARLSCTKSSACPADYVCAIPPGQAVGFCRRSADGSAAIDSPTPPDMIGFVDSAVVADTVLHAPDGLTPAQDGAMSSETGSGPDTTSVRDDASDVPTGPQVGPDLGPDTPPDVTSPRDQPGDGPSVFPDSVRDVAADTSPDVADRPRDGMNVGPDTVPDVAADVSPDVAPDLPPPVPDLAPDLPTKKELGALCAQADECGSNYCASGVCCNRSCTGVCEECTVGSSGVCSYKSGTECLAATSCMNAAVCSGTSSSCPAATPKPAGTLCGTITCSGSVQSGSTCNGFGSCGASTTKECYPYACVSGSGCKTSCATNADCIKDSWTFCGKNGVCTVDSKCWHVTEGASNLLWQVNPKEISDPEDGPYAPKYHRYSTAGSTPNDVCNALSLCGFDDWRVPTISELRTLVRGCPSVVTGGACGVTDTCLGTSCDAGCTKCEYQGGPTVDGCYWPAELRGPCSMYWSSSVYFDPDLQSYRYRFIGFSDSNLWSCDPSDAGFVRCVRDSQ